MSVIQGCLSIEVNGKTVGTFRIVRYIVGVHYWGVSVKRGSTVQVRVNGIGRTFLKWFQNVKRFDFAVDLSRPQAIISIVVNILMNEISNYLPCSLEAI